VEISVIHGDAMVTMALEEYLVGVLLGELPDDFSLEAKKAQAVVARTYALAAVERGIKHPGAVCTDSSCCQSWAEPESYWSKEGVASAKAAVEATRGQVISYEGKLIEATYFSGSGGRTEAAVAVWGSDIPYLQSVESPGEEGAAHHREETVISLPVFLEKLSLSGPLTMGTVTYTEGGGVDSIVICGKSFAGTQVRQLLGLRSTAFRITLEPGQVRIQTAGYGHRVGMSQYGAQAMAEAGNSWQQILAHYYPGTEIIHNYSLHLG
jgi:stage II sporulation protein D